MLQKLIKVMEKEEDIWLANTMIVQRNSSTKIFAKTARWKGGKILYCREVGFTCGVWSIERPQKALQVALLLKLHDKQSAYDIGFGTENEYKKAGSLREQKFAFLSKAVVGIEKNRQLTIFSASYSFHEVEVYFTDVR